MKKKKKKKKRKIGILNLGGEFSVSPREMTEDLHGHLDFLVQLNLKSGHDWDPEEHIEFFGKPTPTIIPNRGHSASVHQPRIGRENKLQFSNPHHQIKNPHSNLKETQKLPPSPTQTIHHYNTRYHGQKSPIKTVEKSLGKTSLTHAAQDRLNRIQAAKYEPPTIFSGRDGARDSNSNIRVASVGDALTEEQLHFRHFLVVDLNDRRSTSIRDRLRDAHTATVDEGGLMSAQTPQMNFHFPPKFWYTRDTEDGKLGFLNFMNSLLVDFDIMVETTIDTEDPRNLKVKIQSQSWAELNRVAGEIGNWARILYPN